MWHKAVLSMELQRRTIYGVDFWIRMLVPPIIQVLVAYFLWDAIYSQGDTGRLIGGYTFNQMMLYYVVAATLYQLVQPDVGIVLREIYDGTLTKFLFYPVEFFQFKFMSHVAHMMTVIIQLIFGLGVYWAIFGSQGFQNITLVTTLLAIFVAVLSGYLFFMCAACIETLGFWVEAVWGLVLMLQFVTNLLGGKLLPLSVFPEWLQSAIQWLPFPYMVSFPARLFLNELNFDQIVFGLFMTILWCVLATFFAKTLWKYGSYNYSGTGM
jgi:ABC-2 type transport system permease protein